MSIFTYRIVIDEHAQNPLTDMGFEIESTQPRGHKHIVLYQSPRGGQLHLTRDRHACNAVFIRCDHTAYAYNAAIEYNAWIQGDVYGFEILHPILGVIDSCWGYYGCPEYCEEEACQAVQNIDPSFVAGLLNNRKTEIEIAINELGVQL